MVTLPDVLGQSMGRPYALAAPSDARARLGGIPYEAPAADAGNSPDPDALRGPAVRGGLRPVLRAGHHRGPAGGARGAHLRHRDAAGGWWRCRAAERSDLFYALLLKDLGCSSNAARLSRIFGADDLALKRAHKLTDWSRGADSAALRLRAGGAGGGAGPAGVAHPHAGVHRAGQRAGDDPDPLRARGRHRADAGADAGDPGRHPGAGRALERGRAALRSARATRSRCWAGSRGWRRPSRSLPARSGWRRASRWRGRGPAAGSIRRWWGRSSRSRATTAFWGTLLATDQLEHVSDLEPRDRVLLADEARLDQVAEAFARVIDAKTPYTARHSAGRGGDRGRHRRGDGAATRRTWSPFGVPACCTTSASSASPT